jgi:hypothetical protein
MSRFTSNVIPGIMLGAAACALLLGPGCVVIDEPRLAGEPALGQVSEEVVYGVDDRTDVHAHADPVLRERARQSTVVLMYASNIDASNPANVVFESPTLQEAQGLCSTERFLDDPTAGFCSGTLIDDDLVLTAGHCARNPGECAAMRIVFNYYRPGHGELQTVTTEDIFSCAEVVVNEKSNNNRETPDYGIIRLDRPATPRFTPAPVARAPLPMRTGETVAVIGSGSGIPFKIDAGGTVRDPRSSTLDYFVAGTDTFYGNSGSGVYELDTYSVAGVLVRGEVDYRREGQCYVVNTCTQDGCRGEDIQYAFRAVEAYCAVDTSARLCGSAP